MPPKKVGKAPKKRPSKTASIRSEKVVAVPIVSKGTGYMFDVIVVRIDAPRHKFVDPKELFVDVNFKNVDLKLTSSRINVIEFVPGRSYEFEADPISLRDELRKSPLKLKVHYAGQQIGATQLPWPEQFINRISDISGELTDTYVSEIKAPDGSKAGSLEIIVRLQTKCKEYVDDDNAKPRPAQNVCSGMDKAIDPNDVLFMVGEEQNPCCCSQVALIPASDSDKSLNPTCLDLSSFRAVNGKTVPTIGVVEGCGLDCSELKKMTAKYQELIESLTAKAKPSQQSAMSQYHEKPCSTFQTNYCTVHGNKDLSESSSSDSKDLCTCKCQSDEGDFAGDHVVEICRKDCSPPVLTEPSCPGKRHCPLCKENLEWLPKIAACPKCGYKPIPYFEERPYNEKSTAEDIIQNYVDRKSSCTDQSVISAASKGRCTCTENKICAHCRIKKLCADIFKTTTPATDCGKCENKPSEIFNVCEASSKDSRPYLARVFSELKDLYDIKETKKKEFEADDRCEKELNPPQTNKAATAASKKSEVSQRGKNQENTPLCNTQSGDGDLENNRKNFLLKNVQNQKQSCKGKVYNYKTVRKYPGTHFGHKTCINGFAGRKNVPHNMGWLWNVEATGVRSGWKPGAIRKPIKQLMKYFLKDFPADTIRVSQYSYRKKQTAKSDEKDLVQKPTLHICKKNGEYFITLRPLKDAESLKHCADPYLNMKPIQFKITKNPLMHEMRKLKQCLKDMGFVKCTCHKPIIYCFCRSFLDKKRLEYQCNKECKKRNIPSCTEALVLSDTTDSDTEFDFGVTPPAGVIKPERLCKRNLVNTGTQYVENDWNFTPAYPRPANKYMKLYNCAIGERFGKEYGPAGKGGKGGPCAKDKKGPLIKFGGKVKEGDGKGDGRDDRKVDMMAYIMKRNKLDKLSKEQAAAKRRERMRQLRGVNPPLLCTIDRKAKAFNPCAPVIDPCMPCNESPCVRDNRIC